MSDVKHVKCIATRRSNPQGIPSSHFIYLGRNLPVSWYGRTPCSVRWLRTMSTGCFSWCRLRMPWGAKKKSTEKKLLEVNANLCCAISLTHSYIQKLESSSVIVPTTTPAENFMEPKPDEVRWSVHVLRSFWRPYWFRIWSKTHRATLQQKQITL